MWTGQLVNYSSSVTQMLHDLQWTSLAERRGNSPAKLRHTRSVAYSAELVLLNKHQISGGRAYPDCYRETETESSNNAVQDL